MTKGEKKVLVIGLDGATFDLIRPWVKEGKLPAFTRLIKSGVSGELASVFPPISPTAWASFMTGKNPGKHGVMDFTMRKEGSYDRAAVNANDIDGETLWNLLSESGKKVIALYVPFAPWEKVNGFIIPGIFSPRNTPTWPLDLENELMREIPNYEVSRTECRYVPGTEDEYLKKISEITDKTMEVTLHLMKRYPWDFLMIVFFWGDMIQHFFWKYMDSQHPAYDSKMAKKYGNSILEYYQKIDRILGAILENIDKQTVLFIVSDHGAGPVYKTVYLNHWLMKRDLLRLTRRFEKSSVKRYLFRALTHRFIVDIFVRSHLMKSLLRLKSAKFFRRKYYSLLMRSRPTLSDVDWTQTKAYSAGMFGQIFLNLKGREPTGRVNPGDEYKGLQDFLTRKLYELKDPERGEKIVDKVFPREEVYWGLYTDRAADLFVAMRDMKYYTHPPEFGPDPNSLTEPPVNMESATHRMNGILLVTGQDIKEDVTVKAAKITDITPTILHILDVPVPLDMDGKVLKEIFEPESDPASRPVKHVKLSRKRATRRRIREEEKRNVRERLRALGYLE